MFAQESFQRRRADAPKELPQGDLDDRAFAHAALRRGAAQLAADLAGKIDGDALRVVRPADSSRKLRCALRAVTWHM